MFSAADLVIVNKTDLLPYVDFDLEMFAGYARRLNPDIQILPLSARTGEQLPAWHEWLAER
jgi:hydrogenase nickel incorporation protein HypB